MEITALDILLRLAVALLLGAVIGTERVFAHKTAGTRTYALVSMGSALFVLVSQIMVPYYLSIGATSTDALRIAAQIIIGIGFLGAGLIIFREKKREITGLTTAAGIWVSAGIGIAAGFGLYIMAIIATVLTLFIFIVLWAMENRLRERHPYKKGDIECPGCGKEIN